MSIGYFYTALLDVLSYKSRLEQDITSGNYNFKDDLEKSLSVLDSVNNVQFNVSAISDTIIITCNSHVDFREFLDILKRTFISFLKRGLFIRGGVAYSRHFQSGKITYSHALARAHELESKVSIYPRIIIDENIIQMYQSGHSLPTIMGEKLFIQQNGTVFLNILDKESWGECYNLAKNLYIREEKLLFKNESAFSKHLWFESYLFESIYADSTKPKYIESFKEL